MPTARRAEDASPGPISACGFSAANQDLQKSEAGNALFFHARYVSPGWRLKRVASIGNHVFYR